MLHDFEYAGPTNRGELHELLAKRGREAKLLAGGTDLLVNMRAGVAKPVLVVDVKKVREFRGITWDAKEGLVIRPAVTINEVLAHGVVNEHFPLLAECAHDLASYQIRNRATVIGNVVNASPCSDMAPALLCLEATAVISSKRGERSIPFAQFFTGVKRTVLQEDELLERIVVPAESAGARGSYLKLKRINGHDLGIVGVALMRHKGKLRLGVSSSAPTPVLVEGLAEGDAEEKVLAAVRSAISPISDVRCSKEYREFMVETFTKRLLREVK